jgi:iron complex outermembrane recepter protein
VSGNSAFVRARDPVRCPDGRPIAGASAIDCNINISLTTQGDSSLKAEESENYSLGVVLQPLPATSITIDIFRIVRSDEITTPTGSQAAIAGNVVRNVNLIGGVPGTGTLLAAFGTYQNANSTTVKGGDLGVRHRLALGGFGALLLDAQVSRVSSFVRVLEDGTREQFAGTHGNCDVTNCAGTPKTRINLGATWDMPGFSVSGVVNFRSAFENVFVAGDFCASTFEDGADAPNDCQISSFSSFDLSGTYRPTKALEIFGSVQNLFDRIAPLDPTTYGTVNYQPQDFSGAMGRYFTLGVKYSFR